MPVELRLRQLPRTSGACYERQNRTRYLRLSAPSISLSLAFALLALAVSDGAQAELTDSHPDQARAAQITLAIFPAIHSGRPMSDDLWPALVTALREELASASPEVQALSTEGGGSQIQIIRGDRIVPGLIVENPITVYLHGECKVNPHSQAIFFEGIHVSGALGWVKRDHGRIESFIHVECDRLGQMLGAYAFGRGREQGNRLMATAIARVILHEWIHVATQNPRHSEHGIAKAQFGVADLLEYSSKPVVLRGIRLRASDCEPEEALCEAANANSLAQFRIRGPE